MKIMALYFLQTILHHFLPVADLPELSVENCTFSQATVSRRRSSQLTGRLVVVNKEKISLFKYRGTVYAVDEICPHTGKCQAVH